MTEFAPVVVVGTGHAAIEFASALRMGGFGGELTVVGEETRLPYTRPSLSKQYLRGTVADDQLALRPQDFYEKFDIRLRIGSPVIAIDRAARDIALADGSRIGYGTLVLATGGRARTLPDPALHGAANVHRLRTLDDAAALRAQLVAGARLVVIGGGYVGLEVAATARDLGVDVTVVEASDRVLARVAGPATAAHVTGLHTARDVRVLVGATVSGFGRTDDRITAVELADGTLLPADVVLLGVGMSPNDALAADCGLAVSDGVLVDEFCRTADPAILAIGDCTRHPDPQWGGVRRLESIPNAGDQARAAASVILGDARAYTGVPWFWSNQFDHAVRSVGLPGTSDTVVERHVDGQLRAVFFLLDRELRAVEIINDARDFATARKLVSRRAVVDPAQLADPTVPLASLLDAGVRSPAASGAIGGE